ncbi:TPA: hypothetical protein JS231_002433 [Escherichia coli]|nr:hypothetical protein [Escherichia coli]
MDEQIKTLLNQVHILEEEANKHSGAERAELFKAAAKVKMEVIKLLPKQGQQPESKVPDPNVYFGASMPDGFGDYFSGDYLTPDMRDYFEVKVPDNVPDAPKKEPDKTEVFDDWEYRRKVLNALGIPC